MDSPVLTEKDLEIIFSGKKKPKTKDPLIRAALFALSFFVVTGFVFLVINYKTLGQNLSYWYNNEYKTTPMDPESKNLAAISANNSAVSLPEINNDSLNLPVINVKAPISWGIKNNPDEVAKALAKGLIQVQGTALPGEIGNVFVTGHSSNYPWAKGNFNNVFSLLNKVVVGDMAQVKYQNTNYLYKVQEIKIVEPDDVSVLESKKESTLTLMTCTPVGTSLRRLIIIANQVYPDPANNKSVQSQSSGSTLPKIR